MHQSQSQDFLSASKALGVPALTQAAQTQFSALGEISEIAWITALPDECASTALATARVRRYRAGTTVTMSGDEACLLSVLAGSVVVEAGGGAVDGGPTDWYAAPASFLTGASLVQGTSVITITAHSDVTIARWPKWFTFSKAENRPELLFGLADILGAMAKRGLLTVADLQLPTAMRRCAAIVLRLSTTNAELAITQNTLGMLANVSRSLTGSSLQALEKAGMLKLDYRKIIVRDRTALALVREGSMHCAMAASLTEAAAEPPKLHSVDAAPTGASPRLSSHYGCFGHSA